MNKDTFLTMTPEKRTREVNLLLQNYDLKGVADLLEIPSSTFSKIMREGDYFYHQSDKQYYPFVRSENERIKNGREGEATEIAFIRENIDSLKGLLEKYQSNNLLVLDGRIYSKTGKLENKSLKMNTELYEHFKDFCEENYPHFKIQDLICQAMINFQERYKKK
jgi:hypothetical protein